VIVLPVTGIILVGLAVVFCLCRYTCRFLSFCSQQCEKRQHPQVPVSIKMPHTTVTQLMTELSYKPHRKKPKPSAPRLSDIEGDALLDEAVITSDVPLTYSEANDSCLRVPSKSLSVNSIVMEEDECMVIQRAGRVPTLRSTKHAALRRLLDENKRTAIANTYTQSEPDLFVVNNLSDSRKKSIVSKTKDCNTDICGNRPHSYTADSGESVNSSISERIDTASDCGGDGGNNCISEISPPQITITAH